MSGFDLTTLWLWVSSFNHKSKAPTPILNSDDPPPFTHPSQVPMSCALWPFDLLPGCHIPHSFLSLSSSSTPTAAVPPRQIYDIGRLLKIGNFTLKWNLDLIIYFILLYSTILKWHYIILCRLGTMPQFYYSFSKTAPIIIEKQCTT